MSVHRCGKEPRHSSGWGNWEEKDGKARFFLLSLAAREWAVYCATEISNFKR